MLVNRGEESNKRGLYTTQGRLPVVPKHVQLHVGWFSETLPVFLQAHSGPVRFANIDCDIYSSTIDVLQCLGRQNRIVSGTVLVFDEYIGYPNWKDHEHRALLEAAEEFGWRYMFLSFSFLSRQAVVQFL
jgi:predicted secreted hydrolase